MRQLVVRVIVMVVCLVAVGVVHAEAQQPTSSSLLLTGGVEMEIGGVEIRADQVDIFMGESRLVASGNVVVTMDPSRALARQINVATTESRLIMSGDVVFATESVRLTADQVEVDMANGTIYASTIEIVVANP